MVLGFTTGFGVNAQEPGSEESVNYQDRHPIFDYSETVLNSIDSVPDFNSKSNPLKITGTVYMSDGMTPAQNVILYITQSDEHGQYQLKNKADKRYVFHQAWVKTQADGSYTFYTFVPGKERRSNTLKRIHLAIKTPTGMVVQANDLVFDNDPLLRKSCRKKLAKKGFDSILKLEKKGNISVARKNIILDKSVMQIAQN
ncbi:protocatechuate 3,4-dioxygenase beta subunit [Gelidibacter sediminis]|uniref:Protocatechuate 3,4-dioxygenase beta subunit n=2 Tax=Gelidibacter sediminis TaxID=1608710 RepID=A0A4R7PYH9_9FLAO|nr:protocatechuate 3,4-dioxygenase beta subunit [Gelidibacter sediminis]